METRTMCLLAIVAALFTACSDESVSPIVAAPAPTDQIVTFQGYVKNTGISGVPKALEVTGTAMYHFVPPSGDEIQPLLTSTRELSMKVQAQVGVSNTEGCLGDVSCEGCQTFNFGSQSSYKVKRQFAVPSIAPDAVLKIEFLIGRDQVSFSHAEIGPAD